MALRLAVVIECDNWTCKARQMVFIEIKHLAHIKNITIPPDEVPKNWTSKDIFNHRKGADETEYFCPKCDVEE